MVKAEGASPNAFKKCCATIQMDPSIPIDGGNAVSNPLSLDRLAASSQADARRMYSLVMPHAERRLAEIKKKGKLFAHYTTAATAFKILESQTMWLRSATVMNDYMELSHGSALIKHSLSGSIGARLLSILQGHHYATAVIEGFKRGDLTHLRDKTFMASLSEHNREEEYGRLSMWRAYGGNHAGVALIFNTGFIEIQEATGLVTSPVLYADQRIFDTEFETIVASLEGESDFVREFPSTTLSVVISAVLRFAVQSTKHLGFSEEEEWRIISDANLQLSAAMGIDGIVQEKIVDLKGIPQIIRYIDLSPYQRDSSHPLHLSRILNHIIIGPSAFPETVELAFKKKLSALDADNVRVVRSDIPLRRSE